MTQTVNATIAPYGRLLRRRRRASHLPALGKAFHIPDEVWGGRRAWGQPGLGIRVQAGEPLQLEPAVR